MRVWWVMVLAGLLAGCGQGAPGGGASQGAGVQGARVQGAGPGAGPVAVVPAPQVTGRVVRIVALGDSLFAGYGLRTQQAYPVRLEAALRAGGVNARVTNAGVSGDTTADGLARLDFTLNSLPGKPDLVLISLGGNDMLRALPLAQTRSNLDAILTRLDREHVPVVMMGMLAAPNLGPEYARGFDAIYPALARKHHAWRVAFFLAPVMGRNDLRLPDHMHPTAAGVEAIVSATRPVVLEALGDKGGARARP